MQIKKFMPIVIPKDEKIDGNQIRIIWKMRIVDESLLPREYLIPDEKKLNGMAKVSKGTLKIPGVEFYPEKSVSSTKAA